MTQDQLELIQDGIDWLEKYTKELEKVNEELRAENDKLRQLLAETMAGSKAERTMLIKDLEDIKQTTQNVLDAFNGNDGADVSTYLEENITKLSQWLKVLSATSKSV